jgi:hypothetical protein
MRSSFIQGALVLSALIGIASMAACSGQVTVAPVTFNPYGSCDTYDGVALIPSGSDYSTYCPGLACQGSYYALCNGTAWDSCSCGIPSGDVEISWSDYGGGVSSGSGADDGGSSGSEAGDDSSSPTDETGTGSDGGGDESVASEDADDSGGSGCTGSDF